MKLAPSIIYTIALGASAISATATEKGGVRGGSEVEDGVGGRVLAYKKFPYEKYHEEEERHYKPFHPYPKSPRGKGRGKVMGKGKGKGRDCEPVSKLTIDFVQGNSTFFTSFDEPATPFLFGSELFNLAADDAIGAVTGVCTRLSFAPGIAACSFTYYDDKENSVTASGDITDVDGGILAITGGTKEFQGAFGNILLEPLYFDDSTSFDVLADAAAYNGTLSIKVKKHCGYYAHMPYIPMVESMAPDPSPAPSPAIPVNIPIPPGAECSIPADCNDPSPPPTPAPTTDSAAPTRFPRPQCETDEDCAYMDSGRTSGVCSGTIVEELGYKVCEAVAILDPLNDCLLGTCVFVPPSSASCCQITCNRRNQCKYQNCCTTRECPIPCGVTFP